MEHPNEPPLGLYGHTDDIWGVALSPDKSMLATASGDRNVSIWNVSTGQERLKCSGHTDAVRCVCFSSNSSMLVSGSWDKAVKVWSTDDGTLLANLDGHGGPVLSVAFCPPRIEPLESSSTTTHERCPRVLTRHLSGVIAIDDMEEEDDEKNVIESYEASVTIISCCKDRVTISELCQDSTSAVGSWQAAQVEISLPGLRCLAVSQGGFIALGFESGAVLLRSLETIADPLPQEPVVL